MKEIKKNESLVHKIRDSVLILVAPAKMLSSPSEVAYKRSPKGKGWTLESCFPSVLGDFLPFSFKQNKDCVSSVFLSWRDVDSAFSGSVPFQAV